MKRIVLVTSFLLALGIIVGTGAAVATAAQPADAVGDEDFQFQQTTADNDTTAGNQTTTAEEEDANETAERNETDEVGETNETEVENETIGPGARLSGIVGAHQAELKGAVSERAFDLTIAATVSNGSRAKLVQNQTEHLETRLQELENETAAIEKAYENGTISNGTYHARSATLSAQINSLERMINQTSAEGERLPADVRAAHGVNMTHLAELRSAAGNATGPEMAAIARSIAGPKAGHPGIGHGPPAQAGPRMGPPSNTTPGAPNNITSGPPNNTTIGPPDDSRMGPPNNTTMGPPADQGAGTVDNRSPANRTDDNSSAKGNASPGQRGSQEGNTGPPENSTNQAVDSRGPMK